MKIKILNGLHLGMGTNNFFYLEIIFIFPEQVFDLNK